MIWLVALGGVFALTKSVFEYKKARDFPARDGNTRSIFLFLLYLSSKSFNFLFTGEQSDEGLYYNPYFITGKLAMAPPLSADILTYDDKTAATINQMAFDVTNFLYLSFFVLDLTHVL